MAQRDEFFTGRATIVDFLRRKWARELDYGGNDAAGWGAGFSLMHLTYHIRDGRSAPARRSANRSSRRPL